MNQPQFVEVSSRDNPLIKDLRKLAHDAGHSRKLGRFWVEGEHLCQAALAHDWVPQIALFAQSAWASSLCSLGQGAHKTVVVPDALFHTVSALESSASMGFVMELPKAAAIQAGVASVILDRVQDPGNVGSILRSAAAFGFRQVIALKGSANVWNAKVLRAGMGAHFGLHLVEGVESHMLEALDLPLIVTSSHQGSSLHHQQLPWPCAWVLGHEGQGIQETLLSRASLTVRIAQPGGEESLNVAAAAAICLHASAIAQA